jgi:hypothetical protein
MGLKVSNIGDWFSYLSQKNKLHPLSLHKSYPAGTLLFINYNTKDEGHIAIIYENNPKGVLFSPLLHSVGWNDGSGLTGVKLDKCTGKSYFTQYNGTSNIGHYTHVCFPKDWIEEEHCHF